MMRIKNLHRLFLKLFIFNNRDNDFWKEVERGHFLIKNICDSDINIGPALVYLKLIESMLFHSRRDKILACQLLYAAWSVLSSEAFNLMQADFELDEYWLIKLGRANDHLFERVFVLLPEFELEPMLGTFSKLYGMIRSRTLVDFSLLKIF